MNEKSDNKVHLHGFVNEVRINEAENGKHFIKVNLSTYEQYKDNAGEKQKKYTFHTVNVVTENPETIAAFKDARATLENNYENREKEGFEPKVILASVDGKLITKESERDGVKYVNQEIIANEEDFKLGAKRQEKESMNTAYFKGNIASIDMHDDFANISIATRYYVPGESENYKGETKPYTEKTSFVRTRISENFRREAFNAIKNGEIEVGDLVETRGQMHNNNYTDKNGVKRYGIIVDLNRIEVVAKKQKQAEAKAETKTEKKAEAKTETKTKKETKKKATSNRRKM